jgi:flavin-dependent dehydrogenase
MAAWFLFFISGTKLFKPSYGGRGCFLAMVNILCFDSLCRNFKRGPMDIRCDVLVVGAGPAGLSSAILLAKKGFSVVVVEKKGHGGPVETSYDITEGDRIKGLLPILKVKPDKVSSVSEWISSHERFLLKSEIQDFYFKRGPDADSLENRLFDEAKKWEVQVFFGVSSLGFSLQGDSVQSVVLRGRQTRIVPRFVIAADGSFSTVGKKLHVEVSCIAEFVGCGVVLDSVGTGGIPHSRIYFDQDIAPGGYVYSGRVRSDSFCCAVADRSCIRGRDLKENLNRFLANNKIALRSVRNFFSGNGVVGIQRGVCGNVLFVGGAAHLYDSFLGYGLNFALESGAAAAQAITEGTITTYQKYVQSVHTEVLQHSRARDIWRNADNLFFEDLIRSLQGHDSSDDRIKEILLMFSG